MSRPDKTFAVGWTLKPIILSIYQFFLIVLQADQETEAKLAEIRKRIVGAHIFSSVCVVFGVVHGVRGVVFCD